MKPLPNQELTQGQATDKSEEVINKERNKSGKILNPKIKQPGRWQQDEHERFVKGIILLVTCSYRTFWEKVEEGGRICRNKNRCTDKKSCTKILQ